MILIERLQRHATERGDKVAVREVSNNRTITYRALNEAVMALARTLPATAATLALQLPNGINFHVAFLAGLHAGHAVLPMDCDMAAAEFASVSSRAGTSHRIGHEFRIDDLMASSSSAPPPGILLQSSGTTGLPKIVQRCERAVDAVAAQMVHSIGITPSDHILSCVPLCHSYGLEHGLLAPLYAGATVHLTRGFDLPILRRELAQSHISIFPSVPSVFQMLAELGASANDIFPALRLAYSAGGPLPEEVFESFKSRFQVRVAQLYGATEVGSITFSNPGDSDFVPQSVGKPMPGVELKIDADGQLLVRAQSMLSSYLDAPSPLTKDGYFPTGDLASIDPSGNLFITGRSKLLIDIGGRKVNPLEVEETLSRHPQVAECAVVPIKLSETVNRLKAVIVPRSPTAPPAAEELRQFAKSSLSAYKVPRVFEVRDALPRSRAGKLLRHLLECT